MITSLKVENFRAFSEQQIDLRPLTILFGPNNSGKSALTSAVTLLTQTLRSPDPNIALLLQGPLKDFGTYKDLVYGNHRGRRIGFELDFSFPPDRRRASRQMLLIDASEDRKATDILQMTYGMKFKYRSQRRETVLDELFLRDVSRGTILSAKYSDTTNSVMLESLGDLSFGKASAQTKRPRLWTRHFFTHPYSIRELQQDDSAPVVEQDEMLVRRVQRYLSSTLENVEFVGPLRAPPARTYLFSGEHPRSVGVTGDKTVDILGADASRRGKGHLAIAKHVSKWMTRAEVAASIVLERLGERHFELKVTHPFTGEAQNIADSGYGCSQVLPVLVAGYNLAVRRGPYQQTFVVEQPEIHLHPKAQAELGEFFLDLANRGIMCIIETHSEHLLLRLQSYVADPDVPLAADDLAVYYVYSPDGEHKVAKRLRLDENGIFIDEWPEGFFPERLEEAKRLARMGLKRREEDD